ncbi:MAG: hypothetical protein WD894_25655 [Pirellulales bacterium]
MAITPLVAARANAAFHAALESVPIFAIVQSARGCIPVTVVEAIGLSLDAVFAPIDSVFAPILASIGLGIDASVNIGTAPVSIHIGLSSSSNIALYAWLLRIDASISLDLSACLRAYIRLLGDRPTRHGKSQGAYG